MATWKRLTDIEKSRIEIDLDTIAFMYSNGNGTEIHFRKSGSRRDAKRDVTKVAWRHITSFVTP
jgi:hypothetical protein